MSDRKLGIVTATNSSGTRIRFDGEESATQKRYMRLSSYTPVVGDRVMLVEISGTYVIIGKVIK